MPNFKLHAPPYVISITGYEPKGGIIRSGRHLKRHDGPTMELNASMRCCFVDVVVLRPSSVVMRS